MYLWESVFPKFNLYHSLGIFSRRQIDDIFLIFARKQDLTFHANCLLRRQFACNVKSCFLGKNKKNISKCRLLKILPRVLSVKEPIHIKNMAYLKNVFFSFPNSIGTIKLCVLAARRMWYINPGKGLLFLMTGSLLNCLYRTWVFHDCHYQ